jgi:hypothetical protein
METGADVRQQICLPINKLGVAEYRPSSSAVECNVDEKAIARIENLFHAEALREQYGPQLIYSFNLIHRLELLDFDDSKLPSELFMNCERGRALAERLNGNLLIAVFGWIDSVIFQCELAITGNSEKIKTALPILDKFRPDQGGDFCLWIAENDEVSTVLFHFSPDLETCTIYRLCRDA